MDIIKEAEKVINTHHYKICEYCKEASNEENPRRACKVYCLPVELFVQILDNEDKEQQIENIRELFE